MSANVNVAVVGTNFGAEFLPIYQCHPDVGTVAICDTDPDRLHRVGDAFGIAQRFTDLDDVLADDAYDAVHLLTPVAMHHAQVLRVLAAGKHCASAVPMGRSLDDLRSIVDAQRESGRNYMMMETAVYGREFLFVDGLVRGGHFGELNFLRGVHIQDLDGFPPYWWGFPPMLYATHALSPLLAVSGAGVTGVQCLGSGRLPAERIRDYDNPFPTETAIFRLSGGDLAAEVTVSFLHTARTYQEGFSVYGTRMGFEWPQFDEDGPAVFELGPAAPGHRGGATAQRRVELPDRTDLLPPEIARFTRPCEYDPGTGATVRVDSHHSGAHPYLAHEFVSSIVERRPARIDASTAARWCAPGICAHRSAMQDGAFVAVPAFG